MSEFRELRNEMAMLRDDLIDAQEQATERELVMLDLMLRGFLITRDALIELARQEREP